MNQSLSVLKFAPLLRTLPWGGRKLGELLGKTLPDERTYGESWELVDLPEAQSQVSSGSLAGSPLAELIATRRPDLMGECDLLQGRFPLLFKFIDARETLSVQVHPDEAACARLGGGARPKTEAWCILHAEPGAKLYLGLVDGVGPEELRQSLTGGGVPDLLNSVECEAGQFFFLPAGMLHTIGEGIVLAEIQQSSDTTYRVFDWNRVGADGKPRQLHVEQALACIDFSLRGRIPTPSPASGRSGLRSPFFGFERLMLSSGGLAVIDGGRPVILACIQGKGQVEAGGQRMALGLGETCLLPACVAGHVQSEEGCVLLLVRA